MGNCGSTKNTSTHNNNAKAVSNDHPTMAKPVPENIVVNTKSMSRKKDTQFVPISKMSIILGKFHSY